MKREKALTETEKIHVNRYKGGRGELKRYRETDTNMGKKT